jgi:hypothetical protein
MLRLTLVANSSIGTCDSDVRSKGKTLLFKDLSLEFACSVASTSQPTTSHYAVPKVQGSFTSLPSSHFHTPLFGLHMANIGGGVISCAHLRHSSLALVRSLSNARLSRDWNSNFSYNGLPIVEASIQHSRFRVSARRMPTFINREPTPRRRCEGTTASQFRAIF